MNRQSGFLFTMQFYETCRIPDETKNILGPKINPPNFQALISPSPEIFPWRINVRISKCLWLVYLSYHPLNFTFSHLTVWTARGQHRTRAVLHQSNCFEYPLKFLLKSSYQQCLLIFMFSKVSYPQRNPVMKNFKTKRKSVYHLGNFNSPLPLIIVCVVLFGCW